MISCGTWNFVFEPEICLWYHELQQNFVALFVLEELSNLTRTYLKFKAFIVLGPFPVVANTFANDTGGKLLLWKNFEFVENQLWNSSKFSLPENLKSFLNEVISKLIFYDFLCVHR